MVDELPVGNCPVGAPVCQKETQGQNKQIEMMSVWDESIGLYLILMSTFY